jgi:hypothetical protein
MGIRGQLLGRLKGAFDEFVQSDADDELKREVMGEFSAYVEEGLDAMMADAVAAEEAEEAAETVVEDILEPVPIEPPVEPAV